MPFAEPSDRPPDSYGSVTPVERDTDPDMEIHRHAAQKARTHAVVFTTAHYLWWGFAFLIYALVDDLSLIWWALAVSAGVALVLFALYTVAGRVRIDVRDADETVGVPVPPDLAVRIATSGLAMHLLAATVDRAHVNRDVDARLRPYRRKVAAVDDAYLRQMHRARRAWVVGDRERWRAATEQMPKISDQMARLLQVMGIPPRPGSAAGDTGDLGSR